MIQDINSLRDIREACLANAEAFLSVAERELGTGVDHVCFHLALLALEEIGKAVLVEIVFTASLGDREHGGISTALDDHIKKIFWALWGGMLTSSVPTEQIRQARGLASTLHEKRLLYLYTDPENPRDPGQRVEAGEAERLVKFTRTRLELAKTERILENHNAEDVQNLKWFFKATDDPTMRKQIFGRPSLKKLEELRNGRDWINWLRELFRQNDEEMRKLAEEELRRQQPSQSEASDPKYNVRVRIQSQSHSVRNNAFQKWNDGIKNIKIHKSDKKEAGQFAKSEILIDFIVPKSVPIQSLWDHAFFMAKTFVIALNIATKGLFWWKVPKDIDRFYEEISDLEADKDGKVKIGMTIGKRLTLAWDDARMVLKQEEMNQVSIMLGFLIREHQKLEDFLKTYALALVMFSKIDIHLRLEVNAFDEFFKAFKRALKTFGDWTEGSDLKTAIQNQFAKLGEMSDLDRMIDMGLALDLDSERKKIHDITLTEVAAIKLYCDFYVQLKAQEYFRKDVATLNELHETSPE